MGINSKKLRPVPMFFLKPPYRGRPPGSPNQGLRPTINPTQTTGDLEPRRLDSSSCPVDSVDSRLLILRRRFPVTMAEQGRRIVVAVDEGDESMYALTWCLQNVVSPPPTATAAEEEDDDGKDTLILLHARPSRFLFPAMDGTAMDRFSNAAAKAVMEKAKRVCADFPNVKVETRVETGDPRDVICEVVEKMGANMLVMGNHGYGLIKRTFLGSVSNHCAQCAKCPVLIVKRPKH